MALGHVLGVRLEESSPAWMQVVEGENAKLSPDLMIAIFGDFFFESAAEMMLRIGNWLAELIPVKG